MCNLSEGIEQKGIEKGKLETAKKMLEKKLNIDLIAEITNLNLATIKNLEEYNCNGGKFWAGVNEDDRESYVTIIKETK